MNNLSKSAMPLLMVACVTLIGCAASTPIATSTPATEPEALSRTEFTDRVENYFEYEPLHAGKPSQVRIHLTDLSDGSPVEKAEVTLTVSPKGLPSPVVETTSRIGKVTGIYVAEITVPKHGTYDIEFRIKNAKADERIPLTDFKVQCRLLIRN